MVRAMLQQTGKIMTKPSVITNRLSITMAGLIIDDLFSSDTVLLCLRCPHEETASLATSEDSDQTA